MVGKAGCHTGHHAAPSPGGRMVNIANNLEVVPISSIMPALLLALFKKKTWSAEQSTTPAPLMYCMVLTGAIEYGNELLLY